MEEGAVVEPDWLGELGASDRSQSERVERHKRMRLGILQSQHSAANSI